MSLLLKHVSRHFLQAHRARPALRRFVASQANTEKTDVDKKEEKIELDFTKFNLAARVVNKRPALPALIKGMFVGDIDERYLPYLEVIQKEHVDKYFTEFPMKLQEFLAQTENPNALRTMENMGYSVPQEFNGNGFELTETTLHNELESHNLQASSVLNAHRLVIQTILDHGTDEQRNKYLPKLANGELVGTVAIFEREISSDRPFNTLAMPKDKGYELSGEKDFVVNGEKANLFLVVASSLKREHIKSQKYGVSAFLVDANDPGVLRGQAIKTLGCEEVEKCTISFANTPISTNRVIGKINEVDEVAQKVLQMSRLQSATMASQVMKRVINHFSVYCTETRIVGGFPKDLELNGIRLGRMASHLYALESMIYFTTQLNDAYDKQDIDLEVAATKLFAIQSLMDMSCVPFNTIGQKATLQDEITAKNIRDAIQLLTEGDSLDMVKLFLGLEALRSTGSSELAQVVHEKRNPTNHPESFWKNLFANGPFDKIEITQHFDYSLHPSLKTAAEMLEVALKHLEVAVRISMVRHGQEIIKAHAEIERLTRCATLVYAILATVSRASRSYCLGVRHADHEIILANTFTMECLNEIKMLAEKINLGENMTNDVNHKTIATLLFDSKGYAFEHPLLRVF